MIVWMHFLYLAFCTSLSISATMMGNGQVASEYSEMASVFFTSVPK